MLYESLLHAIGNTPLVKVPFPAKAHIFAKLEYLNPGGSVKDRAALFMIEKAEREGLLKPGGTIIEASSGNQGISAAMIGAIKGYRVIITVSEKVSEEKKRTLTAYGAEIIICPATTHLDDPRGYHARAVKIQKNTPNSFMLNQYFNASNEEAHYHILGPEIWRQTGGLITHFVAAAGSGGTVSGAGRYLKEKNPTITVIAVDAATSFRATSGAPKPYKIEGMGIDYQTPLLNETIIDQFLNVHDTEAIAMLKNLAQNYGMLVGPASGAVAAAVENFAKTVAENSIIVMPFTDSGRAYLSKDFYS